jgi:ribosomal protein L22
MEARAVGKYIRVSPQKARLVADVVRGMDVDQAITTLKFHAEKRLQQSFKKVIESAVANATQDDQVDVDNFVCKENFHRWWPFAETDSSPSHGQGDRNHQANQPHNGNSR